MAALDRAVALTQVDAMTVPVDRDLYLDVPVLVEPLLEVERVVPERRLRLAAADLEHGFELTRRADHAHPLAAATGRGLDQYRLADPFRLCQRVLVVAEHALGPRDGRQAVRAQELPRARLAREPLEHVRRRPDERQPVRCHDLGETLVFG
jgi:hypothetical protein